MKILLTGMAGFIGFHMAKELQRRFPGSEIVGLDSISDYYDPTLKKARLRELGFDTQLVLDGEAHKSDGGGLRFVKMDLCDEQSLNELFAKEIFDTVVHLAAQPGVRYSLVNPQAYIDSNVTGFMNILSCCKDFPPEHLVYASSSSVYGTNKKAPFSETDRTDSPASLYAATKKMNEAMAYTFAHLYGVKASGLRFFTVYGEWCRPDMALMLFTEKIMKGEAVELYNYGDMERDFTYVGDVVKGVSGLMRLPPSAAPPHDLYNIGYGRPVALTDFVRELESALETKAKIKLLPMQPGDLVSTHADVGKLKAATGYAPGTNIHEGVKRFAAWYREYNSRAK